MTELHKGFEDEREAAMASTGDDASPPPDAARLIELSDERDQWERLALDRARSAYRHGYTDGHDAGYRTGYEQAVREWKITAAGMTHLGGPAYAEQDKRRYPPDGRQSWIISASDREGAA